MSKFDQGLQAKQQKYKQNELPPEASIYGLHINGVQMKTEDYVAILNPSDGECVGYAPVGSVEHIDMAVAAAKNAQKEWKHSSIKDRQDICRNMAKVIEKNAEELALLLTLEQGKPLKGLGSEFEIAGCVAWTNATADMEIPVKVIQDDENAIIEQHREPVGVVGSITPWNWPLLIAIWHIIPAIRTGNAVVIKPSPFTPLSTLRLVELLSEVLPKGLLNAVCGPDIMGAAMSRHQNIDKIIFTGSTGTGKKIMESAATNLKRLTLELGGNDAGIVLPDADPSKLAESIFWGAFINNGQTCSALKRLYVHDSIYDAVCAELVKVAESAPMGDGRNKENVLGPLQNMMQFDRIVELVEDAKKCGCRVLTGGAAGTDGRYFYPATLIADAQDGMRIVDEEQFGPVLPIIRYTDIDDVIVAANQLDYGLAASVWTSDPEGAREVASALEAGTVYINKHAEIAPHVPFGGVKQSGIGVEFGIEGLEACTDIKIYNIAK